ncbi:MAG: NAD(P)-dependent oxidoreductase [Nakamurella sp.]
MTSPLVLVTSRSFSTGTVDLVAQLEAAGVTVVRAPLDHNLTAMTELLDRAAGWIAGTAPITAEHLAAAQRLKVIARYGVGVDAVDLSAAAKYGVVVTNTPGANSDAVAEHALALLLAALRHVVAGDRRVRAQNWTVQRTKELKNLTVGIAGYGRIGQALADRLRPFGTTILAFDPMVPAATVTATGARPCGLAELAALCDAVSLHAPGQRRIIDDTWLSAADNLILINTARSSLVDEGAVARALRDGRLASYAADEVGEGAGETESPVLAQDLTDRVILTPHSAAQTVEAVDNMGVAAVQSVLAVLAGTTPSHVVRPA